jgi:peptidyl-prolyl cis-trans isomerase C
MIKNSLFSRPLRALLLVAGSFVALTSSALPQAAAQETKGQVIARVNGVDIYKNALDEQVKQLGGRASQVPADVLYNALRDQLVTQELVAQAAAKAGLDNDPEVASKLLEAKARVLQEVYLKKTVEAKIDENQLKTAYEEYKKSNPPRQEARASHILVDSEAEALELIKKLDDGGDFSALAKDKSKDPGSGQQGGDLGWFTAEVMVPEFSTAAFALEPGTYTKAPVKSQFGWHIIKLAEKRQQAVPAFDTMRGQLTGQLSEKILEDVLKTLRGAATVEEFDADGKPVPAKKG